MKRCTTHAFLLSFVLVLFAPLYLAFIAASHEAEDLTQFLPYLPGKSFWHNLQAVLTEGVVAAGSQPVWRMLVNSFIMSCLIAAGKVILSVCSAFALVYFQLPFKKLIFILIFTTMMLPIEVRIVPTFQVTAFFNAINTYSGLTLPLIVSATALFLFRQFFKTLAPELVDMAILDGAGPWRFFRDILLPLSKSQIAALFITLFVYGWNQYLWPLVVSTSPDKATIVMGMRGLASVVDLIPQWHYIMMTALLAMLPPCVIVLSLARFFEKGIMH